MKKSVSVEKMINNAYRMCARDPVENEQGIRTLMIRCHSIIATLLTLEAIEYDEYIGMRGDLETICVRRHKELEGIERWKQSRVQQR